MKGRPFACRDCDGCGTAECPCCDSEIRCSRCGETGLDPDLVNAAALDLAVQSVRNGHPTWLMYEDGQHVGVCGGPNIGKEPAWRLWYRDFPPEPKKIGGVE